MKRHNPKHYHEYFVNEPRWYLKTVTTLITKSGLKPEDIKVHLEDIVKENNSYKKILETWSK